MIRTIRKILINESFILGYKDQLPLNLGVIPFGLVFGAYAISIGIPPIASIAFPLLINAGSSQIAALGLLVERVNPLLIIFSIALINLRFVLYSASLTIYMQNVSTSLKLLLAYWLTDATFLLILKKYQSDKYSDNLVYSFGVGFGQWLAWELSCVVGIILGPILPSSMALDFALPLLFITLLMGHLTSIPINVSAVVSAAMAVILVNMSNNMGLFFSIIIGIAVGLWAEQIHKKNGILGASI